MNAALTIRQTPPNARIAALFSDASWVAQVEGVVRRRSHRPRRRGRHPSGGVRGRGGRSGELAGERRRREEVHPRHRPQQSTDARARRREESRGRDRRGGPRRESAGAVFEARDMWQRIAARIPAKRAPMLTWFVRVSLGDSLAEIAEEAGVDYPTAQARYLRMRKELQRHAVRLGAAAAIARARARASRVRSSRRTTSVGTPPAPAPTQVAPPPKSLEQAAELRRIGMKACAEKQWAAMSEGFGSGEGDGCGGGIARRKGVQASGAEGGGERGRAVRRPSDRGEAYLLHCGKRFTAPFEAEKAHHERARR